MNYYVKKTGNDTNSGSKNEPFLTISKAAEIAVAGDIITVHEGIYREWINPKNGGSQGARIIYQAAENELVVITGAEIIENWDEVDGVWRAVVSNEMFKKYNPYKEIIGGDWFFDNDKEFHTGEVYLNGKSMYESLTLGGVKNPVVDERSKDKAGALLAWYCEVDEKNTTIWANFGDKNPNEELIEINVRPFVFWPSEIGRGYITVKGFHLKQAATQWAPPTALQTGLIGPHWSKGWVIEDNVISDAKNVGISLGKEIITGQNEWTKTGVKGGTQREREVIFRALHNAGWTKENVGGHLVRNNIIKDCEQAAIVGHLGSAFCIIEKNHIFNIHQKMQWHGAEVGGIKFHGAIDTVIRDNIIHDAYRGLWLDWQAQGTLVSRNIFYNNSAEDFMAEVCHGPYLLDHNIFLSKWSIKDMSTGGAFVHNLFLGKIAACVEHTRYTPYHFPHDTAVYGVANILGGDNRYFNNIFIKDKNEEDVSGLSNFWNGAVMMDGVPSNAVFMQTPVGLSQYDEYPDSSDEILEGEDKFSAKLPMYVENNLYVGGAKSYVKEINPFVREDGITVKIVDELRGVVEVDFESELPSCEFVDSRRLGVSYQAEMGYVDGNGANLVFIKDYFNHLRVDVTPGPFEVIDKKKITFGGLDYE